MPVVQPLLHTLRDFGREIVANSQTTWAHDNGKRRAPEPPPHGALGHLAPMAGDNMGHIRRWWETYGDIYRLRFGFTTAHVISHPRFAKQVLQENHRAYSKQTHPWKTLSLIVGAHSVLTTDGETWLRQRRVSQPEFNKRRIEAFVSVMNECSDDILASWSHAGDGGTLHIAKEMNRVTLEIISRAAFGTEMGPEKAQVVREAVHLLTDDINRRLSTVFGRMIQVPTEKNLLFRKHASRLDAIVYALIEERRKHPGRADLLTRLLEARDPDTGERMSDAQLHDEVMTIFLAGHETTSQLLSWTWVLLSQNPDWEAKLHAELDEQLGDGPITVEALKKLPVLHLILQESMRLYPPAWMTDRGVEEDDTIGGMHIPKSSVLLIPIWLIHRHPDFWQEPDQFNPTRFVDGPKDRWAYIPFGAGPRLCLGQHFALLEAAVVLATLARRFKLRLIGDAPKPLGTVTLKPSTTIPMQLSLRA